MNKILGGRLLEERKRLGLTQGELAEIGGVKLNAQINYEKDKRSPNADYWSKVEQAGIDVLYVITGRREETKMLQHLREKLEQIQSITAQCLEEIRR